jgi:excisionase family DNA binding protein
MDLQNPRLTSPNIPCYTAGEMTESTEGTSGIPGMTGRFLTVAEVARQLRVSNMTVYRLIKSGNLGAVRVGRGYRIPDGDLRKYLSQRYMDAG